MTNHLRDHIAERLGQLAGQGSAPDPEDEDGSGEFLTAREQTAGRFMSPEERAELAAFGKTGPGSSEDFLRERLLERPDQLPTRNAQRAEGDEAPRVATLADLHDEAGVERARFAAAHLSRQFDDAVDQQDAGDQDDEAEE